MNMESKEKWIDKVLDSGTSIKTVSHQPFLYRKTMNRMELGTLKSTSSWWSKPALAVMLLLVFVNCFTLYNYSLNSNELASNETEDISSILEDYSLQETETTIYNF